MFEQVARQIADYIQAEQLEPGSKLPTERQLSELLQVSRSSVREGIRVLELLRFLDSKQGEGTFVSDPPPFLIPDRVIGQKLEPQALRHYYEIALMCAETVLMLSIQHHVRYSNVLSGKTFWENLLFFITGLGESLENPYFFLFCFPKPSGSSCNPEICPKQARLLKCRKSSMLTMLPISINSKN